MDNKGTIILTSAGFKVDVVREKIFELLPKPPQQMKIAHIITASNVAPDTDFVRRDKEAMVNAGFDVTDIELEEKTKSELYDLLSPYDIIYVQGGNGFYLLNHVWKSGFDNVVKQLLQQGKWYVGVSAGTYICCPTIEMHTWKRDPDEWYGLTDLKAMNLVPFLVTVHYNREKYRELLAEKIPTASHPVRILTDEQALVVKDGEVNLIGEKPEVLVENIATETE